MRKNVLCRENKIRKREGDRKKRGMLGVGEKKRAKRGEGGMGRRRKREGQGYGQGWGGERKIERERSPGRKN